MLNAATRMPSVMRSKKPVKRRIAVKTSVDKPMIMASVAAIERRSFQILILIINLCLLFGSVCVSYIICCIG